MIQREDGSQKYAVEYFQRPTDRATSTTKENTLVAHARGRNRISSGGKTPCGEYAPGPSGSNPNEAASTPIIPPFPHRESTHPPASHARTQTHHPTPLIYLHRAQLHERFDRFAFLRIASAQAAVRQRARRETDVLVRRPQMLIILSP
jgi:hypothetical protein